MANNEKKVIELSIIAAIWTYVKYILLYCVGSGVMDLFLWGISKVTHIEIGEGLTHFLLGISGFLVFYLTYRRKYQVIQKGQLEVSNKMIQLFLPTLMMVIGFQIVISEIGYIVEIFFPVTPEVVAFFQEGFFPGNDKVLGTLSILIVAPITEELVFRGIFLQGLLRKFSTSVAVILSALFFAIAHFNPWQFPVAFFMGLLLAWVYIKTDRIILCMLLHAMNNAVALFLSETSWIKITGLTVSSTETDVVRLVVDIVGGILLVSGLYFMQKVMSRHWSKCLISKETGKPLEELNILPIE